MANENEPQPTANTAGSVNGNAADAGIANTQNAVGDANIPNTPVSDAGQANGTATAEDNNASHESLSPENAPVQAAQPQPEYGAYSYPTQQFHVAPEGNADMRNTVPVPPVPTYGFDGNADNGNQPFMQFPPSPNQKPQAAPKPVTKRTVIISSVLTGFITLLLTSSLIGTGALSVPSSANMSDIGASQSKTDGNGSHPSITSDTADWRAVSEKVAPSVVSIQTKLSNGVAAGSGAVIDADNGYIITNNHVVSSAKTIYVTLSNGQIYEASLKGSDATTDIAILKLDTVPKGLKAVRFADSDSLKVGQPTMAIGNPLGYSNSASTGIISALNRPVSVSGDGNARNAVVTNAIQVDAAVNQGNSGGPLFNASGEVIGITSSIASVSNSGSSAGSIGIGFAIPSNLAKKVGESIVKDGSFSHAQLGVTIKTGTVKAGGVMRSGASVESVVSGEAADKAGVKKGDVIVAYNGNAVDGVESVLGYVRAASVGDKAKLTIVRDGTNVIDITVTLDKATEQTQVHDDNDDDNDGNEDNGLRDQLGEDGDGLMDKLFGGNGGF